MIYKEPLRMSRTKPHKVAIIMGSDSDFPVMKQAIPVLEQYNINYEVRIISAHRTPLEMVEYAQSARDRGIDVIIAGAGGAAHLPGMVASITSLPVIGVPVRTKTMDGFDSMLSIQQMPGGIPVATAPINHAGAAAQLAVRMCQTSTSTQMTNAQVIVGYHTSDDSYDGVQLITNTLQEYGITVVPWCMDQEIKPQSDDKKSIAFIHITKDIFDFAGPKGEIVFPTINQYPNLPTMHIPIHESVYGHLDHASQLVEDLCFEANQDVVIGFLAVNAFLNAALMVVRIAGISNATQAQTMEAYQQGLRKMVREKDANFAEGIFPS